jgi:hypothetical protein
MTHEELEDAVPLYAVGALERVERQAMEAHLLSGCVSCHTALKEYQSVAVLVPFGLNLTAPPRTLKGKIMAARTPSAVEPATQQPAHPSLEPGEWMNHLFPPDATPRARSLGWALGLAGLAILAVAGYLTWMSYAKINEDSSRLIQLQAQADAAGARVSALQQQLHERDKSLAQMQADLQHRASDIADLKDQLIQREAELDDAKLQLAQRGSPRMSSPQDELAALLRTPTVTAISMAGTDVAKQASGLLLYDSRTQKVWFYSVNLPENPNGATYQLWAIHEKPLSVGLFHVGSGETTHLLAKPLPSFLSAKKFAVSLEPPGGRPQPTGPLYLISHS